MLPNYRFHVNKIVNFENCGKMPCSLITQFHAPTESTNSTIVLQSNPYGLKDTGAGPEMGAWTSAGLQPTTGYYSYDPMSAYG